MTEASTTAQARGRIGGLTRAALAPTRQAITQAARDARWSKYVDQVRDHVPGLAALADQGDEAAAADITRRAELLRKAEMCRLSQKAAAARRMRAQLRALEAELDASGLKDCASDGIDAA